MIKLSAVIITYNEEKNIERCIKSLQEVADEIVVVDSFSSDKTAEICQSAGVKFLQNKFGGHIEQKNFALMQAVNDCVLSLDADEALGPTLLKSIIEVKKSWESDGYYFNRLNNYAGHWVRHCGWYPDRKLRLLDRGKGKWGGDNPHDIIIMDSGAKTQYIAGDLLHYSYDSVSDHVEQTNKFTSIAAKAAYQKGVRSSILKIVSRPLFKLLKDYFLKRGFLDGKYGFIICYINALSAFLKYTKIKEIESKKSL